MGLLSILMPQEQQFFEMLDRAAANAVKATSAFKELIHNWSATSEKFERIREIESEGDLLTHEVIDRLNRTFITPIDREDIHRLAGQIDDICDIIQAMSDRMQLYHLSAPMPETMVKMTDLLETSAEVTEAAVKEFHNFKGTSRVHDLCIKIKHIENEADDLLKHALAGLFQTNDVMQVIKWKEIYESVERAHDKLSEIANTIEGVIVKNA
jgi:predicted phosphate transport protein (TIGR00153 family)